MFVKYSTLPKVIQDVCHFLLSPQLCEINGLILFILSRLTIGE